MTPLPQVCVPPVEEAAPHVGPEPGQLEDCVQGEHEVRDTGEGGRQTGRHRAAAPRGVLEVNQRTTHNFSAKIFIGQPGYEEFSFLCLTPIQFFFRIDKFFLKAFPMLFFVFNITYWTTLIFSK